MSSFIFSMPCYGIRVVKFISYFVLSPDADERAAYLVLGIY